jgi:hypothetical protein
VKKFVKSGTSQHHVFSPHNIIQITDGQGKNFDLGVIFFSSRTVNEAFTFVDVHDQSKVFSLDQVTTAMNPKNTLHTSLAIVSKKLGSLYKTVRIQNPFNPKDLSKLKIEHAILFAALGFPFNFKMPDDILVSRKDLNLSQTMLSNLYFVSKDQVPKAAPTEGQKRARQANKDRAKLLEIPVYVFKTKEMTDDPLVFPSHQEAQKFLKVSERVISSSTTSFAFGEDNGKDIKGIGRVYIATPFIKMANTVYNPFDYTPNASFLSVLGPAQPLKKRKVEQVIDDAEV